MQGSGQRDDRPGEAGEHVRPGEVRSRWAHDERGEGKINIVDQIFIGMIVLIGEKGKDWNYYVSWPPYWQKWGELNRNSEGVNENLKKTEGSEPLSTIALFAWVFAV